MHIRPTDIDSVSFDWGTIKWFVTPSVVPGVGNTQGEIIILPGQGHAPHRHPSAEELLYVISGEAEQTVGDGPPFTIREGDMVHVPINVEHSTENRSWRPLRLLVTYTPGGEERALESAPDYRSHPAGQSPAWQRIGETPTGDSQNGSSQDSGP